MTDKEVKSHPEIDVDPDDQTVAEATHILTPMERRKRAMTMRRYRGKMKMARARLRKRKASTEKLKKRAMRKAIGIMKKKVAAGKNYADMSPSEKMMVDKRVQKRKAAIERLAKRMLPQVRQAELERLRNMHKNSQQNESIDYLLSRIGISAETLWETKDDRLEGTPERSNAVLKATPGQPKDINALFENRFGNR